MRIVVDENIPNRTIDELRGQGHAVTDIKQTVHRAGDDETVWEVAQKELALLVSTDKGFADNWDSTHHGILIVRLRQPNREKIHERVMQAMKTVAETDWPGLLLVMRDQTWTSRRSRSGRQ